MARARANPALWTTDQLAGLPRVPPPIRCGVCARSQRRDGAGQPRGPRRVCTPARLASCPLESRRSTEKTVHAKGLASGVFHRPRGFHQRCLTPDRTMPNELGPHVRKGAVSCQSCGFLQFDPSLGVGGKSGWTTRFIHNRSRYVSIYFRKTALRYRIVAELWLNHGNRARFAAIELTIPTPRHKGQALEQVHILFVF